MLSLPKKILPVFCLLLVLSIPQKTYAAGTTGQVRNIGDYDLQQYNQDRRAAVDAADKGQTLIEGRGTNQFMLNTLVLNTTNSILCTDNDSHYCDPRITAMGNVTYAMRTIYDNPPASFAWYMEDTLANAGLAPKAYAQGIGFVALSPLLEVWKAARNIAYAVLIIIMVTIGFMIIFRMKIDPKTVISIQAALPKIVLTLILVTFSYPIVGFLIDMMYVVMAVVISVMANAMGGDFANQVGQLQTQYMTGGVPVLLGSVFSGGFRSLGQFVQGLWPTYLAGSGATAAILAAFASAGWMSLLLGPGIIAGIFLLILVLGLLFTFIRILMLLVNSYIQILISLILGPILLLREAIPGQSAFTEWILNIMANLSVFPATVAVLLFGWFLTTRGVNGNPLWVPPLAGLPGPSIFPAFLGISVIFMAPNLIASIKKMFHPKPALPISAATPLAPITGAVGTSMGAMQQFYYFQMTAGGLPVIGKFLGGGGEKKGH